MWLLIDDTRDLYCDAIARTPEAAKELLAHITWECICFDHDLGTKESGYDIMKWMFIRMIYPNQIQLVTSNPVGRDNMIALLKQERYTSSDNVNWLKEI
jgi:hypothetical protein